jgi:hypothetical protein
VYVDSVVGYSEQTQRRLLWRNLKEYFTIQFPAKTAWGFVFEPSSSIRHATITITITITMNIYTHAVSSKKWRARAK